MHVVDGYLNPNIWLVNKVHIYDERIHNNPMLDGSFQTKGDKAATHITCELFPKVMLAPTSKESLCFNK
jgi:hypothetical protein